MEEKTRLGRGLEEVSRLYFSGERPDVNRTQSRQLKPGEEVSSVRICHPGSCQMQSFLCANLALELVRNRFCVFVWDSLAGTEAGMENLMGSLVTCRNSAGKTRVSLYGLPDIVILTPQDIRGRPVDVLKEMVFSQEDRSCLLVSAPAPPVSVADDGLDAQSILAARADEKSLLQCYAYMRIILQKKQSQGISLIFDDPTDKDHARALFNRFAAFVEGRLGVRPDYLGALHHDEHLDRSIEQARPLMLLHEDSEAKEDMVLISTNFLLNSHSLKEESV